jgi:PAS domain S-box-containing protein
VRPGFVTSLDFKVCDLLTGWAGRGRQSGRVVLVEVDEQSLGRYGRWPWPRDMLGALVNRVADAGAATVVLDMILSEEDRGTPANRKGTAQRGATNDEVLAAALARVPSVAGYSLRFDGHPAVASPCSPPALPLVLAGPEEGAGKAFFRASDVECMVPALANAAAGSGFLNAAPDPDGMLRVLPLVIEYRGQHYPSLALSTLIAYKHTSHMEVRMDARGAAWLRLDNQEVPLEGRSGVRLRYRGAHRSFPYVSAADLLSGRAQAGKLRDKIAIIGASAHGLRNVLVTPFDPLFPDVELHATAIDNLLQGDLFHRPSDGYAWEVVLALAAGLASTLTLALIRSLRGAIITAVIAAAVWTGCFVLLVTNATLVSPLPATFTLSGTFVMLTMLNYRAERRRAERTERRLASAEERAEVVRQESETRYQRLVENVSDAIIMRDAEGRLLFANRRFREWFGLKDQEIADLMLEDYVAPEWRESVREQHRLRIAGTPVPDHQEYEGICADGTRIWIEAQVTTVEAGGRIVGTQSALRDVSERKRLEAQYLQAQKMESVGRLAGGVAHDFNNLLTVINGYSELLASKLGNDRGLREMAEQILRAGKSAAELTTQLLTFSRKQVAQARPLELNVVVQEAQKMFSRIMGEDVQLESKLSPTLGQVMADPGQMHQVLMNLVVNARDSMPGGGRLTIETRNVDVDEGFSRQHPEVAPGRYVYLGVTDTGSGMSEEVKRQIFEPFFTTKEKGKGTGLGLATVYGIVRHGEGWIRVDSAPGAGTTFHIYLPRTQAAAQAAATAPAAALAKGSETVLLVEDEDAVRELTEQMLKSHGYRVLQAASGAEALELAASYPGTIHLLMTDVILPQMNGQVLAEALWSTRPEIKVLYMSGYSEEVIGQGMPDRRVAYLAKPFSSVDLAAKVRQTLASEGGRGA